MILLCLLPVASIAASLVGPSLVLALSQSPQEQPDGGPPTPKEQALIEHACPTMQRAGTARNAYERCFSDKLASLRADFGRDLSRLSAAARKKIDLACTPASATLGREAYIACLSGQLALLSARPAPPPPASAALSAPVTTTSAPAPEALAAPESSGVPMQNAAAGVAAIAVLFSLVVFFGVRSKRPRPVCRVCSVRVPAGDICAACRHEAAEAVRRAAAERSERQRADEAEQHRQRDQEEHRREQQREEDERLRRVEEGRRLEDEARRRDEAVRQQEEDALRQAADLRRSQPEAADTDDSTFDPYHALGLAPDATGDAVRAAYEEARLKYAPDQVAHLGNDAQDHFAAKFRAVDRAYRMLTGETPSPLIEAPPSPVTP